MAEGEMMRLYVILVILTFTLSSNASSSFQLEVFRERQDGNEMILLKSTGSTELLWTNSGALLKPSNSYIIGVFERKGGNNRTRLESLYNAALKDAKDEKLPVVALGHHAWKIYVNRIPLRQGTQAYDEALLTVIEQLNASGWVPLEAQKIVRQKSTLKISSIWRSKETNSREFPIERFCKGHDQLVCHTRKAFFYFN